jgi:hypothetical protein
LHSNVLNSNTLFVATRLNHKRETIFLLKEIWSLNRESSSLETHSFLSCRDMLCIVHMYCDNFLRCPQKSLTMLYKEPDDSSAHRCAIV